MKKEIRMFMMSKHFDRVKSEEFGLVPTEDPNIYLLNEDGSRWVSRDLYDFGWGKEKGFVRIPLPSYQELLWMAIYSDCFDNRYGAASIIHDEYSAELLQTCNNILASGELTARQLEFFKILQLDQAFNRSNTTGKTPEEVMKDYKAWKSVADRVKVQME